MPGFTDRQLRRMEWISGGVGAAGLAAALLTFLHDDRLGFWHEYVMGLRLVGWLAAIFGVGWCALAAAHRRTAFFDVTRRVPAQTAGIGIGAIALCVAVVLVVLVPRLPNTPPEEIPPDSRKQVAAMERNFRWLVSVALVGAGGVLASFPARKMQ